MKEVTVGIHNGEFHADEVFAMAILKMIYSDIQIKRTRDNEVLKQLDFRVDVGRKYNPRTKDFDHHQIEFTTKRKNGIPYASAGLIWKNFGKKLTNSKSAFEYVDEKLIQPIDADDNGMEIAKYDEIFPYTVSNAISSFNFTWDEDQTTESENNAFNKALGLAESILERVLKRANSIREGEKLVLKSIKNGEKFAVLEKRKLPYQDIILKRPEIKFIIFPAGEKNWLSIGAPAKKGSFERRAYFPEKWAGSERDLEEKSGVKGAKFCHKDRFILAAETKEGAIELTKLALQEMQNETN